MPQPPCIASVHFLLYLAMQDFYIPRIVEKKLFESMNSPIVTMITGARQVGKSTLMQKLKDYVEERYSISETQGGVQIFKNVFEYTLDDIQLRSTLRKDSRYLEKDINLALGENLYTTSKKVFVFIDEVQKFPALLDWIKQVFDKNGKNVKFVITGSSALSSSKSIGETLAGRIEYIHVYPIIYPELTNSRLDLQLLWLNELLTKLGKLEQKESGGGENDSQSPTDIILGQLEGQNASKRSLETLSQNLQSIFEKAYALTREFDRDLTALVLESMFYGGLPRLYNVKISERVKLLRNYISVYLEKEIGFIARNIDLELFGLSLQSFAAQNGDPLNINQVSKEVGVGRPSLYRYLDLLENTFLIKRLYPYKGKAQEKVTKSVALYYLDTGILNTLLFVSSIPEMLKPEVYTRNLGSFILLNILVQLSLLDNPLPVYYWQDYHEHKVDFVVDLDEVVLAFVISQYSDKRKLEKTKEKFSQIATKPAIYVHPIFDPKKIDLRFRIEEEPEFNAVSVWVPLQLLV